MHDRTTGLGASDAAAACGLSRWGSPLGLYLEKTGQWPSNSTNPAMRWGTILQGAVVKEFLHQTGRQLVRPEETVRHPTLTWLWSTPDGWLSADELVEAKTAGWRMAHEWGEPGTDEIPTDYIVQTQVQMAVTGAAVVFVPVLIAGQDFRIYRVDRNQRAIDGILPRLAEFWKRVERRDPPEADLPGDAGLLDILRPPDGSEIHLNEDAWKLARQYVAAGELAKQTDESRAETKAALLGMMGAASVAILPDGWKIRRSHIAATEFTVKKEAYVQFRVYPPRKKETNERTESRNGTAVGAGKVN